MDIKYLKHQVSESLLNNHIMEIVKLSHHHTGYRIMLTNYNEIQLYTIHIVHSPSVKDGLQEDGVPPLFYRLYMNASLYLSNVKR